METALWLCLELCVWWLVPGDIQNIILCSKCCDNLFTMYECTRKTVTTDIFNVENNAEEDRNVFLFASNMTNVIYVEGDKYKHCLCFLMSIFELTNVFLVTCKHIKIVNIHFKGRLFNHCLKFYSFFLLNFKFMGRVKQFLKRVFPVSSLILLENVTT